MWERCKTIGRILLLLLTLSRLLSLTLLLDTAHQHTAAPVRMLPRRPASENSTDTPDSATMGSRQ